MVADLPPGLTHPATAHKWFGYSLADHHFRWVDGDRYVAVLNDSKAAVVVDAIPFVRKHEDPRVDLAEHAIEWARRRGRLSLRPQPQKFPRRPR